MQPPEADFPYVPHYRIERELGRGGMGVVYLAVDERLDRAVALKVIRTSDFYAGEDLDRARARFRREAQLAARLSHPGLVTVYAFEQHGDMDVIVMERVEGEPLSRLLAAGRRWTPTEAARLLAAVADAVAAAHAAGIVHRDLKPANIMLLPDGGVKVLDFGIAKAPGAAAQDITVTGNVFGTVSYMAPEQVKGRQVGPWTDVFSLGVTGYELVTGERAFGDGDPVSVALRIASEQPPHIAEPEVAARVFGMLAPVLTIALAKEPSERYADAGALGRALAVVGGAGPRRRDRPVAAGEDGAPSPAPARGRAARRFRWPRPAAVLAGLLVVGSLTAAGGIGYVVATRGEVLAPDAPRSFGPPHIARRPAAEPAPSVEPPDRAEEAAPDDSPAAGDRPTPGPPDPPDARAETAPGEGRAPRPGDAPTAPAGERDAREPYGTAPATAPDADAPRPTYVPPVPVFDASGLRPQSLRYGMFVDGRQAGELTLEVDRTTHDGRDAVRSRSRVGTDDSETEQEVLIEARSFQPMRYRTRQTGGPVDVTSELRFRGDRVTGTVSIAGQRIREVDVEVPPGTLLPAMDDIAIWLTDFGRTPELHLMALDPETGSVYTRIFRRVGAASRVRVRAGTFEAYPVEVQVPGADSPMRLWVRAAPPHLMLRQELPDGTAVVELTRLR